jgi:hypothetical protein
MDAKQEQPSQATRDELKSRRRRARWRAFLTPIIMLTAIVALVGFLMFILRACKERFPQSF